MVFCGRATLPSITEKQNCGHRNWHWVAEIQMGCMSVGKHNHEMHQGYLKDCWKNLMVSFLHAIIKKEALSQWENMSKFFKKNCWIIPQNQVSEVTQRWSQVSQSLPPILLSWLTYWWSPDWHPPCVHCCRHGCGWDLHPPSAWDLFLR